MSSRLIRGDGVASEPVAWPRVSPLDAVNGECIADAVLNGPPATSYLSEPATAGSGGRAAADLRERLRATHQQGFEEGQAAALERTAAQVEGMQKTLARSIEELTGARARYRREAEQDVVGLALAVARRILHRELTVAPEALLGLVKAALEKMDARELHRVRVAPSDAMRVRQFLEQIGIAQRVEVAGDGNVPPGGVILESKRGQLDASVYTQLAEIERGFADIIANSPSGAGRGAA